MGDGLTDFKRVNRRMHNKSFTVDDQVTIIGGRNIAEEYFGGREDVNFGDLDVLGIGPVVGDVSRMFDSYWNHRAALPVPAFAKMPDDPAKELERLRERIAQTREEIASTRYAAAVRQEIEDWIASDLSIYTWAPYQVVYDSPDKAHATTAKEAASIVDPLREAVRGAHEELMFISPYFVPRKSGIEGFRELMDQGLRVRVITNSLASTNHSVVHSGYAPSRKPLLRMGVELYEVRPDSHVRGTGRAGNAAAEGSLHTKAFVVDRQKLFVGSFNLDPRSAKLNTELGVIIESPELAGRRSIGSTRPYPGRPMKSRWTKPASCVGRVRATESRKSGPRIPRPASGPVSTSRSCGSCPSRASCSSFRVGRLPGST